jgi:hypothetical protein
MHVMLLNISIFLHCIKLNYYLCVVRHMLTAHALYIAVFQI